MKGILIMMVLFVVVGVCLKSCNAIKGGDMVGSLPGFGAAGKKEPPARAAAPAPAAAAAPVVKQGDGFKMHVEKFRGFLGYTSTLRTDLGQYTPGRLCVHGLVQAVSDREARIKTTEGLVVVVAVDDYTRPAPVVEEEKAKDKTSLAPEPVHVNAKPTDSDKRIAQAFVAPALPDVPMEERVRLSEAQKRQVRAGIPIAVQVQPAGSGTRSYKTQ